MKTIVAIWGPANQGKSSTVKLICKEILTQFPNATTVPLIIDYSIDIKVIITLNGKTIGIESQGDPSSRIFRSLDEFGKLSCDIIICSTRSSGATVEAVSQMHEKFGYDRIWATNYRTKDFNKDLLNQTSADQIIELIKTQL